MGEKEFYAHSDPSGLLLEQGGRWHLLAEHLEQTALLARNFADSFGAGDWGYLAGLWHDAGKYSEEFQRFLRNSCDAPTGQKVRIDHSTYGAQKACQKWTSGEGKILAYVIAGHHSGLPDGKSSEDSCLTERLTKSLPYQFGCPDSLFEQHKPKLPFSLNRERSCFEVSFFIRMLFSCLVDADFLDTERHMTPEKAVCRAEPYSLTDLYAKLENHLSSLQTQVQKTKVNSLRAQVLSDCLNAAAEPSGLFSLTVPTGGGKTLSSMAFALKHAVQWGLRRIIYVIPYTSIIEQNAKIFRDLFGDRMVLEHHSNYDSQDENYRIRPAVENWDAPIIVTTNVQFFESLYTCRSSRARKLHNIAKSVVVLDEVQTLPSELLLPCLEVIRELALHYQCSFVLCSATQPAVGYRDDFRDGLQNVREIVQDSHRLYEQMKRVRIHHLGIQNDQELIGRLTECSQVLCIVNTRKHARTLFQQILSAGNAFHLSASMYPLHRSRKLKEIREALSRGSCCRVVSTQLVEAGVDIDFPVVYRAIAGLDSIAQAAGRCNREGVWECGEVFVFEPAQTLPPGYFRHTAQIASEVIRRFSPDILSLEAVEEYFRQYYWSQGKRLDKENILELIRQGAKGDFPFRTIAEKFRIIPEETKPVIVPLEQEACELVEQIRRAGSLSGFSRKLQKYTVQISPFYWDNLVKTGSIEVVQEVFPVLMNLHLYDENVGLCPEDQNPNPEWLIA